MQTLPGIFMKQEVTQILFSLNHVLYSLLRSDVGGNKDVLFLFSSTSYSTFHYSSNTSWLYWLVYWLVNSISLSMHAYQHTGDWCQSVVQPKYIAGSCNGSASERKVHQALDFSRMICNYVKTLHVSQSPGGNQRPFWFTLEILSTLGSLRGNLALYVTP